jgi:hypothetical protein
LLTLGYTGVMSGIDRCPLCGRTLVVHIEGATKYRQCLKYADCDYRRASAGGGQAQPAPKPEPRRGQPRCYCGFPDGRILADLKRASIPEDALTSDCCWRRITRVRGYHMREVSPEAWREITTQRGYLLWRQNPRGF